MTPKEIAKQLFDKFYYVRDEQGFHSVNKYRAKQCALIAVEEIYQANINIHIAKRNIYWDEVKKEINKL